MRALRLVALPILAGLTLSACGGDDGTGPDPEPIRTSGVPASWFWAASATTYETGLDQGQKHGGSAAAYIASTSATPASYALFGQFIKADAYRGKRVRLSGWLKPTGVSGQGARLWMRVDGPYFVQSFDNMHFRPALGTSGWKQYSVVLNVPADAVGIGFGTLMYGAGDLLIDDLVLEEVDQSVASTAIAVGFAPTSPNGYDSALTTPANMGFDAGFQAAALQSDR